VPFVSFLKLISYTRVNVIFVCLSLEGRRKTPTMSQVVFFITVNLLSKDLRLEHGSPNLFLAPGAI